MSRPISAWFSLLPNQRTTTSNHPYQLLKSCLWNQERPPGHSMTTVKLVVYDPLVQYNNRSDQLLYRSPPTPIKQTCREGQIRCNQGCPPRSPKNAKLPSEATGCEFKLNWTWKYLSLSVLSNHYFQDCKNQLKKTWLATCSEKKTDCTLPFQLYSFFMWP